MKKYYLYVMCFTIAALNLTSCGDDGPIGSITKEVELKTVSFEIPASLITSKSITKADGDLSPFFGEVKGVNKEHSALKDFKDYESISYELLIKKASIKITKKAGATGGTSVKSFTSTATGITSYQTPSGQVISLDKEFSDANLTEYIKNILAAVRTGKTVDLTATGETDIIPADLNDDIATISLIFLPAVKVKLSDLNKIK